MSKLFSQFDEDDANTDRLDHLADAHQEYFDYLDSLWIEYEFPAEFASEYNEDWELGLVDPDDEEMKIMDESAEELRAQFEE